MTNRDLRTARRIANLPITRGRAINIRGRKVWRVTQGTWRVDGETLFLLEACRKVLGR